MREEGYYWVRTKESPRWQVAQYRRYNLSDGTEDKSWLIFDCLFEFDDSYFIETNETRILPPQN